MSTQDTVIQMIREATSEVAGQMDRQDVISNWYRADVVHKSEIRDGLRPDEASEAELAIVAYVMGCKDVNKAVFAVANSEVAKVTKEVNEELELHYSEENEKTAGCKVDVKQARLVVAGTRATKKVKLVEMAKAIVKQANEGNLEKAELVMAELMSQFGLEAL